MDGWRRQRDCAIHTIFAVQCCYYFYRHQHYYYYSPRTFLHSTITSPLAQLCSAPSIHHTPSSVTSLLSSCLCFFLSMSWSRICRGRSSRIVGTDRVLLPRIDGEWLFVARCSRSFVFTWPPAFLIKNLPFVVSRSCFHNKSNNNATSSVVGSAGRLNSLKSHEYLKSILLLTQPQQRQPGVDVVASKRAISPTVSVISGGRWWLKSEREEVRPLYYYYVCTRAIEWSWR